MSEYDAGFDDDPADGGVGVAFLTAFPFVEDGPSLADWERKEQRFMGGLSQWGDEGDCGLEFRTVVAFEPNAQPVQSRKKQALANVVLIQLVANLPFKFLGNDDSFVEPRVAGKVLV